MCQLNNHSSRWHMGVKLQSCTTLIALENYGCAMINLELYLFSLINGIHVPFLEVRSTSQHNCFLYQI